MHTAEIGWRAALDDLEHSDKGRKTVKAGKGCYLGNGKFRIDQQIFSISDPFFVDIFVKRNVSEVFKEPTEVVFTEAGFLRNLL